jgi:UDP-N-acetylmuramate dehydrogenase
MSATTATHSVDLQPLHTFGLPARAIELRSIRSHSDVEALVSAVQAGQSMLLLGEGSNTVFLNPTINATVWKVELRGRYYLGCHDGYHHIRVMAGENWHHTVEWTVAMGWAGLENLALIPGSVGASPVQNIGAYGVELKDRLLAVHTVDMLNGQHRTFSLQECQFAYRDSLFKQKAGRYLIVSVDFALAAEWQPVLGYGDVAQRVQQTGTINPASIMKAICDIRTEKLPDPAVMGNCGSFFKNPVVSALLASQLAKKYPSLVNYPAGSGLVKLAAGWLIDQCGLKGFVLGGVRVYENQALILVNRGDGKSEQLLKLIQYIQMQVAEKFGVELEPEPNLIC